MSLLPAGWMKMFTPGSGACIVEDQFTPAAAEQAGDQPLEFLVRLGKGLLEARRGGAVYLGDGLAQVGHGLLQILSLGLEKFVSLSQVLIFLYSPGVDLTEPLHLLLEISEPPSGPLHIIERGIVLLRHQRGEDKTVALLYPLCQVPHLHLDLGKGDPLLCDGILDLLQFPAQALERALPAGDLLPEPLDPLPFLVKGIHPRLPRSDQPCQRLPALLFRLNGSGDAALRLLQLSLFLSRAVPARDGLGPIQLLEIAPQVALPLLEGGQLNLELGYPAAAAGPAPPSVSAILPSTARCAPSFSSLLFLPSAISADGLFDLIAQLLRLHIDLRRLKGYQLLLALEDREGSFGVIQLPGCPQFLTLHLVAVLPQGLQLLL